MNRTFKIIFSIKNVYHVNVLLYLLKKLPVLNKISSSKLYGIKSLKILANILSIIWEFIATFVWKCLYLLLMVWSIGEYFTQMANDQVFLHILLMLTIIGANIYNDIFDFDKSKYYLIILMRMNAKEATINQYIYNLLNIVVGFMPFTIIFGLSRGVSLWMCILLPFCIAGVKVTYVSQILKYFEKTGDISLKDKTKKLKFILNIAIFVCAYLLPYFSISLPKNISIILFLIFIPLGLINLKYILEFRYYYELNKNGFNSTFSIIFNGTENIQKELSTKIITTELSIKSNKSGFEYLNELFIKRHKKIFYNKTRLNSYICIILILVAILLIYLFPDLKMELNAIILKKFPIFHFIVFIFNSSNKFTETCFMNCDYSLLTYAFYKKQKSILKLFIIRLREIIKINIVPVAILAFGLAIMLHITGGSDNPLSYAILVVSILFGSVFLTIHNLALYYLLQPYTVEIKMKSLPYSIISNVTALLIYLLMRLDIPLMVFGLYTILFCILYFILASVLIYFYAPKTFKLKI